MFTSGDGVLWPRERRNLHKLIVNIEKFHLLKSYSELVSFYLKIFLLSPKLYTKKFTLLLITTRRWPKIRIWEQIGSSWEKNKHLITFRGNLFEEIVNSTIKIKEKLEQVSHQFRRKPNKKPNGCNFSPNIDKVEPRQTNLNIQIWRTFLKNIEVLNPWPNRYRCEGKKTKHPMAPFSRERERVFI